MELQSRQKYVLLYVSVVQEACTPCASRIFCILFFKARNDQDIHFNQLELGLSA